MVILSFPINIRCKYEPRILDLASLCHVHDEASDGKILRNDISDITVKFISLEVPRTCLIHGMYHAAIIIHVRSCS